MWIQNVSLLEIIMQVITLIEFVKEKISVV